MSRIGNNPVVIPEGVTITQEGNVIKVKGSLGELTQDIDFSVVTVSIEDNQVVMGYPAIPLREFLKKNKDE